MKKLTCAIMMFLLGILCLGGAAMAAGQAEVAIKGEAFSEGTDTWDVTCEIDGDTAITNGKFRITYDSTKLKLESAEAGALLDGLFAQINDPISGNKEEGEVVLVFADANGLDAKGVLLNLKFHVEAGVKNGDEVTVSVSTEELVGGGSAVTVNDSALKVSVGGSAQPVQPTDPSADAPDSNTEQTPSNGTNDDNAGFQENPSQNNGDTSTIGGDNSSTQSNTDSTAKTVNPVKTGDSTNIILPIVAAIVALAVLAGSFWWKKKKK